MHVFFLALFKSKSSTQNWLDFKWYITENSYVNSSMLIEHTNL
jgi:hypothetical protein